MIPRWLLLISVLLLALLSQPGAAKKSGGPRITETKLDHDPNNLFYFEDSDNVLYIESITRHVRCSFDAGETWAVVKTPDGGDNIKAFNLWQHPYDRNKAYILGEAGTHWITTDQAKTWTSFKIDMIPSMIHLPMSFHGWDSSKVIIQGEQCAGFHCKETSYYTVDDFKTVAPLRDGIFACSWAVGSPEFAKDLGVAAEIGNRVLCIVPGLKPLFGGGSRLVYSDSFFGKDGDEDGVEVKLQAGRPVSGILNTAAVKKFLLVAARSQGTDELALYVSDDARVWHRAEFGNHRLEEDAYTILESTNYSIQVDVLTTGRDKGMGVLFTSNSNGTYFTRNIEHTNRNPMGLVDFEKIANIQGIVLVNAVDNWEAVEKDSREPKKVVSRISFDDGRTFQPLTMGDKKLNLHSVTAFANVGRVFSSPAPGLVMGVGNTGSHLEDYLKGDLFVSDDAGVTWRKALDGSHKYEFGDQGAVIIAVEDDGKTDKIRYSIDHGKEWETAELPQKIYPRLLTTTPDSTSLKFLLVGSTSNDNSQDTVSIYSIDFNGLHERKCEKDDFEKWPARLDEKGEPDCLMGHKQYYRRRKANADCFIDEEFKNPDPIFEPCKCTADDFECDYNFVRSEDRKSCVPAVALAAPEGQCRNPDDTYMGPSGWRLIPGNACQRDGGEKLDDNVKRPCGDTTGGGQPSADGPVSTSKQFFDSASTYDEYYYLERQASSSGTDETILMRTRNDELYVSHDHGETWQQPVKGEKIVQVIPHPYYSDGAFFLTDGKKGYWTVDRVQSPLKSFETPALPNQEQLPVLIFHPKYKDWLIWTGAVDCNTAQCHSNAWISKNRGESWELLLRYVRKCEFVYREDRVDSADLVFCEQFENENQKNPLQLLSSKSWFTESDVHFKDVIDFASMAEFIVVAARDKDNRESLKASTSVDGSVFAAAEFPANLQVPVQKAYTVLDSSTHAVFLHVTVNNAANTAYGSLVKSNSNGTSYVLSLNGVNRNDLGYVDFEKMQGLEGVAVVNTVGNLVAIESGKANQKKLKTMITHNDGAQWALLPPPAKDANNKNFGCSVKDNKPTDKCALHLHGYTERRDPRDTYSSGSAIGLMMGVGNVGEYLSANMDDADTFLTRDGGITWKAVKKGRYMWEYGDAGSVIVIVPDSTPTKSLFYSTNEGDSWTEFQFSDVQMEITDISTLPSDTSKKFLLWGREVDSDRSNKLSTVSLDFSGLRDKSCQLNEDLGENEDYYLWKPRHPLQDNNCLFGHIEQYHRRKPTAECWNDWREPHVHSIGMNCTCTRADYECDYNYEPQSDGSCALVPGLPKPNAMAVCKSNPDQIEYWEPTGYRRIPLTTCQGGLALDRIVSRPCPDHEQEYEEKHGISGVGLFFAIVIPVAVAGAVGYWAYTRWDGKFGQIRLGENVGVATGGLLSRDSPFVAVPVVIIAGVVAVAQALPLLVVSLWRSASGYLHIGRDRGYARPYASRRSFAARRGDYTSVVDDEDELLGADDLEDDEDEV
ncbi:hypothetical protein ASPZODRAFT_19408 [Penicilliopsis zonata CBS 506.65]|uniref:Vacuolar protein sorting/targeting protein 10 n=1 Tax=Penicilliopsis zonata CBS 506.65 TaxID=1073090 RepID=A0A1L9S950_9EURO|nr:hypothetical protein ASPZODRAFT_19408 [Penicilliopsis zonata CBS 506.65]OJJ43691.1 hypothetical protein ASPZODRAFT_19408 [Penicilliopsis zonata CBS 506.65]